MTAKIFHAELWGNRDGKYSWLAEHSVETTEWEEVTPDEPFYLFKPFDKSEVGDYYDWPAINDVMPVNSVGIVTSRDDFVIDFERAALEGRIDDFVNGSGSDETMRDRYLRAKDKIDIRAARMALASEPQLSEFVHPILYRPFDSRWICYYDAVIERTRRQAMPHMLAGENLAIGTTRLTQDEWSAFSMRSIMAHKAVSRYDIGYTLPLYLYPGVGKSDSAMFQSWPAGEKGRRPNLDPGFVQSIEQATGMTFIPDGRPTLTPALSQGERGKEMAFGPEDVLAYIYAVFHCPEYRRRFEPMLKIDFPRVPPTQDQTQFKTLCELGRQLIALHLLEDPTLTGNSIEYPNPGSNKVEKGYPKFIQTDDQPGRIHINRDQYFEPIEPEVWNFQIGGYQVPRKWLKDRKERTLTHDEIKKYTRIIEALRATIQLRNEIDDAIRT